MANTYGAGVFRSSSLTGYIGAGFLGLMALISALIFFFSFIALAFPDFGVELEGNEWLSFGLIGTGVLALIEIPVRIVTAILFLIWLYRAFDNLSALKANHLEFTPGWSVGWWFIPFANLVKPFQVVRELYNESDPDFDRETGFLHVAGGTPFVIGLWWGTFLISGFAYRLSDMLYGKEDLPSTNAFFVPLIVGAILSAISASLAAHIMHTVIQRQEERSKIISAGATNNAFSDLPKVPNQNI